MSEITVLIDGSHLSYRAYHTFTAFTNSKGDSTAVAYGFFSILNSYIRNISDKMIITWDTKPYWRSTLQESYKEKRNELTEEEKKALSFGFSTAQEICEYGSILQLKKRTYEADDLIAYCVKKLKENILIVSGDKDLLQFVDDSKNIKVMRPSQGSMDLYDESTVLEKYKITPKDIPIYLSIMGDKSDNIIGVRGMGKVKTAQFINKEEDPFGASKDYFPNYYKTIQNNMIMTDLRNEEKSIKLLEEEDVIIKTQDLINLNRLLNKLEIKAFNIRDFKELYGNNFDRKIQLKNLLIQGE